MERRTVITGLGWITPLGTDIEGVWKALLAGESGLARTTLFDASTFPSSFSAEVKDFALDEFLGADAETHKGASRNTQFALAAAVKAWEHAGLRAYAQLDPTRVGIYLGGGEGPLDFSPFAAAALAGCRNAAGETTPLDTVRWAEEAMKLLNSENELEQEPNLAGGHLANLFNAQGPSVNTLTACAASTQAIGEAMHLIRSGDADLMITGGSPPA